MPPRAETLATLRASGRRVTVQRQTVLDVVEGSARHLDAEAIYQLARVRDHGISLATVYRTLAVLKNMGLVEQSYLARDHAREHYEPVGSPEHYHFTCLGCHKVIEFKSTRVKQMTADLNREIGVQVLHVCACLEGYCQVCAAKRKAGKE